MLGERVSWGELECFSARTDQLAARGLVPLAVRYPVPKALQRLIWNPYILGNVYVRSARSDVEPGFDFGTEHPNIRDIEVSLRTRALLRRGHWDA